jgi:SAM-dependent methyltransferase
MNTYIRPEKISADMGGDGEFFDDRLIKVFDLLELLSFDGYESVLDIGTGKAQIAKWFAKKGFAVTGTGLSVNSYEFDLNEKNEYEKIEIIECNVEQMPFEDGSFDIIIMSHVLEHCYNTGLALQEVKRVLSPNGMLCIFVPPHDDYVCAGHVSMGWNLGQLMYILLVNGFDIKQGKFAQYGYNVTGIVRKGNLELPQIRGDRGDIHILDQHGLWPLPIVSKDGLNDNFFGRLRTVNWDIQKLIKKENNNKSLFQRILLGVLMIFPVRIKHLIAVKLYSLSRIIALSFKSNFLQSPN